MARKLRMLQVRTQGQTRSKRLANLVTRGGSLNHFRCRWSKTAGILFAILALAAALPAYAATVGSPLHFPRREGLAVRRAAEAGERLLDLDVRALGELRQVGHGQPLRLEAFPFAPGMTGDLLLERFEVATADAKVLVQTDHGTDVLPMPVVAHFRGRLDGDSDSRVYIGVQAGFLVAIVKTGAGIVYVGPEGATDGPVQHVLRSADSPLNDQFAPADWRCDADELPQPTGDPGNRGEPSLRPASATTTEEISALKEATVSIETDQELLAKYSGNVTNMAAYITTLVGQISVIYERDVAVRLTVNVIQAWTTTDPYSSTNTRTQLDEVGDWWHANRPKASYPRTTVHYMSGKPVSGGIAWLGVLCMGDFSQGGHWGGAYGVTQLNAAYPGSPWDLIAVAHELGHNFGSPHTHCYSPSIDTCYNGESGCYSGTVTNPGPLGGTIMSYCHLLSGGYGNVDLRFHERCISEQMLPEINSVSCLGTIPDAAPTAANFYSVTPCRAVDTRNPTGQYGGPALEANTSRVFAIGGRCGVPATARALALNLTVTGPTAAGNLRAYPPSAGMPLVSAVNYRAGQTRANGVQIGVDPSASLAIRCDQASGSVQVIMDITGYYQ